MFVSLVVFVCAVVQAHYVHYFRKTALEGIVHPVHTLCYGSGRVEFVTQVLQFLCPFYTHILVPLLWYLVADAPHHY